MTSPDSSFANDAFAAAAKAYAGTPESWALAVQAAIAELFDFLASHPEETKACVLGGCDGSSAGLTHRDRVIERFTQLLAPGFAASPTPPPAVVAEAIGGGIYELVRHHVLERRLEELPVAAPDATVVALSPFLGPAGAIELVSPAAIRTNR